MIETNRLIITLATESEMRDIIAKESDEEMVQAYTEMLEGFLAHPDQQAWYGIWMIRRKEDREVPVGDLCFKGLGDDGMVEIGYGTYPEYQCRGYMTEAVIGMTAWALQQPGVTRVEAETDPDNVSSQRVLEKAGYQANGVMGEEGPRFVWVG